MKKIILTLLSLAFLGWVFVQYAPKKKQDKILVKIGVVLPLSGSFASSGENLKNAVLLAQEDINRKDNRYKYQFIIDNDAFDAKRTIAVLNKHISIDEVDAEISFASQAGKIVSPVAQKNQVLHINFGASDADVAKGEYNFVHWTSPSETTKKMLEFYQEKNLKNVVAITSYNAGTIALEQSILSQAEKYDVKITPFYVQPTEKDFRMLLVEVKRLEPDAVLVLIYGDSIPVFMKQCKEVGIKSILSNIEAFTMLADLSIIEGMYLIDVPKGNEEFLESLKQKNPKSGSFGVGHIYDAAMLIAKAFEKADRKENAHLELAKLRKYQGQVGEMIQDENGFFSAEPVLEKVINQKLVILK